MSLWDQIKLAVAAFLTGCLVMFYVLRVEQPVERPAAEIRHTGGAVTLRKDPEAAREADRMAPKPALPAGKPTRTTIVTVKPKPQPKPEVAPQPPGDDGMCLVIEAQECPPVTVRLDMTDGPDGTRVTASSPDGEILGGLDVPRVPLTLRKEFKWSAGVVKTTEGKVGGYMDRDVGILRVGVVVVPDEAHFKLGLRF